MVLELFEKCTLAKLEKNRRRKGLCFSDDETRAIIVSILKALSYLHNRGIIYRNLTLKNIMLTDFEDLSKLKLIDFSISSKDFKK